MTEHQKQPAPTKADQTSLHRTQTTTESSTSEGQQPPPATFLDYAFQGAENAIDSLISGISEIRSVAVVFDWSVPVTPDVPAGIVLTRGPNNTLEQVAHPLALFGILQQNARLGLALAGRFQSMLAAADQTAKSLAKAINERQAYLNRLNEAIAQKEAELRDLGGNPADTQTA